MTARAWLPAMSVLLAAGAAAAAELRLEGEFPSPDLKRDVSAVCGDVLEIYENKVAREPALGSRPVVLRHASDGWPRASLAGLPDEYHVHLTCLRTRSYCQIVYQLGHELGHVWMDPRRSNWFIESAATALSLVCLGEVGEKWKTRPPFPNWADYAPEFQKYRDEEVRKALKVLDLESREKVPEWVASQLPRLVRRRTVGRASEHACALTIEEALRRHPTAWGALTKLGAASERGRTDFARWQELVAEDERPLVEDLAGTFGPLMGQDAPGDRRPDPAPAPPAPAPAKGDEDTTAPPEPAPPSPPQPRAALSPP